jgi:hypothetical protein
MVSMGDDHDVGADNGVGSTKARCKKRLIAKRFQE